MPIRAVWFDVGEVLVDETREYGTWADWLGVPRHTFSAVFGAVIAQGRDYRDVFQVFRPGFDLDEERQKRIDAGVGEYITEDDLYHDARSCLQALKDAGYFVGIAGNQTARIGEHLRSLNLPCDVLATSDDWRVAKPNREFFERLIKASGHPANEIVYVGDRHDNDIRPAGIVGIATIQIRRGPWAHTLTPAVTDTPLVSTLTELPAKLAILPTA